MGCPSRKQARRPSLTLAVTTPADERGSEIQQLCLSSMHPARPISPDGITATSAARLPQGSCRGGESHVRCEDGLCRRYFQAASQVSPGSSVSARPLGALGVDVERTRLALGNLGTDHDLLDAIETRQFKHGVE